MIEFHEKRIFTLVQTVRSSFEAFDIVLRPDSPTFKPQSPSYNAGSDDDDSEPKIVEQKSPSPEIETPVQEKSKVVMARIPVYAVDVITTRKLASGDFIYEFPAQYQINPSDVSLDDRVSKDQPSSSKKRRMSEGEIVERTGVSKKSRKSEAGCQMPTSIGEVEFQAWLAGGIVWKHKITPKLVVLVPKGLSLGDLLKGCSDETICCAEVPTIVNELETKMLVTNDDKFAVIANHIFAIKLIIVVPDFEHFSTINASSMFNVYGLTADQLRYMHIDAYASLLATVKACPTATVCVNTAGEDLTSSLHSLTIKA
jgi:hypothetical protein